MEKISVSIDICMSKIMCTAIKVGIHTYVIYTNCRNLESQFKINKKFNDLDTKQKNFTAAMICNQNFQNKCESHIKKYKANPTAKKLTTYVNFELRSTSWVSV